MKWLFALALLLRLSMLALEPFSTDTQRFLADGLNAVHGKNPYTAPAPIEIKYAHLRSFYPPLQEAFFAAAVSIWPNPKIFRILGGLAELFFLFWFFRRKAGKRIPQIVTFFLLFNPLSIHEVWREGHLDHIGVYFLYFAIVARGWRRYAFAAAGIGWKFVGFFAIAFRWMRGRGWRFSLFATAFFAIQFVPAFMFTPFAENGLLVYKNYWHHGNGVVHALVSAGFAAPHAIYLLQIFILLLVAIVAVLYFSRRLGLQSAVWFSLGSMLVLFPVQHPWYYFLILPAVLLSPRWRRLAASLCFVAPLSYLGYTENFKSAGYIIVLVVWVGGCIIHLLAVPKTGTGGS